MHSINTPQTSVSPRQSGSKVFYGWVVVILATFAVAVTNGLSIGGIPIFYRSLTKEFGWNRTTIATAGAALLLARGLAGPFTGQLWDRYGPKRFMAPGAAVMGVSLIIGYFISAPSHLYSMVLLMALGLTLAGLGPGAFLASSWFIKKRGIAMGIVATGTSMGGIIFSPISTWLITRYDWRAAMIIYAVFSFAVFTPLMYFFVKNRPADIGASADPDESDWFLRRRTIVKSVVGAAAVLGIMIYSPISLFLVNRFNKRLTVLIFIVLGIILQVALAKYFAAKAETRAVAATAKLDPEQGATAHEALCGVSFWALLLGSSLCYYVIFAITQQFVLHLLSPQVGFSPDGAAWAYSSLFFFSLLGKSLFGFLSDRFLKRSVNLVCCAMMFVGALILLDINQENTWFFCTLFGLGYGGITVTTKLVLAELFGLRSLGKLLGIMMGAETIFGSGGNLLTGRLFDTTGNYHAAFKVMAVCSIASVFLMAMLGRKPSTWTLKQVEGQPE